MTLLEISQSKSRKCCENVEQEKIAWARPVRVAEWEGIAPWRVSSEWLYIAQ